MTQPNLNDYNMLSTPRYDFNVRIKNFLIKNIF